jgi:hypothetical protein
MRLPGWPLAMARRLAFRWTTGVCSSPSGTGGTSAPSSAWRRRPEGWFGWNPIPADTIAAVRLPCRCPGCGLFALMLVQRRAPPLRDPGGENSGAGQHAFPEAVVQPWQSGWNPDRRVAARSPDLWQADKADLLKYRANWPTCWSLPSAHGSLQRAPR